METHCIPLVRTGTLSPMLRDLLEDSSSLRAFRQFPPGPHGYDKAIEAQGMGKDKREQLLEGLQHQYKNDGVEPPQEVRNSIEALREPNTYTVSTGHQPCLFSGPLLFIHKSLYTIRLAEELQERHPGSRFIPVHWMASEDHDREEIDHLVTEGEYHHWKTEQEGAVGRMEPEGLDPLLEKLEESYQEHPFIEEWMDLLRSCYRDSRTIAEATRKLLTELFGKNGLIVLDGDDKAFKARFKEDLKKEITEQRSAHCVRGTNEALEKAGYDLQVHPRSINLFYLRENYRERIESTDNGWKTVDEKHHWSEEELLNELEDHPEHFSPNVILRPLYQERLLPDVAYVSGPAEYAYWHQLKGLFEEAGAFFPLIQLRDQVFHIDTKTAAMMERSGVTTSELFEEWEVLTQEKVKEESQVDLELQKERAELKKLFEALAEKAASLDPNLRDSTMAEHRKAEKGLERMQKKMLRQAKKQEEGLLDQLQSIREKLFPNGSPQERVQNITPFYAREGKDFLDRTGQSMAPLQAMAVMIVEKEA